MNQEKATETEAPEISEEILKENSKTQNPCELNPQIKLEIVKMCIEKGSKYISNIMKIPILELEGWTHEYQILGKEEFNKQEKQKNFSLTREQKSKIISECEEHGYPEICMKYGLGRHRVSSWKSQMDTLGGESVYILGGKVGCNNKYTKDIKLRILEEIKELGEGEVAARYDIDKGTLSRWQGKFRLFGENGLVRSARGLDGFTPVMKYMAICYYQKYGAMPTYRKYGCAKSTLTRWKKSLRELGVKGFLGGEGYIYIRDLCTQKGIIIPTETNYIVDMWDSDEGIKEQVGDNICDDICQNIYTHTHNQVENMRDNITQEIHPTTTPQELMDLSSNNNSTNNITTNSPSGVNSSLDLTPTNHTQTPCHTHNAYSIDNSYGVSDLLNIAEKYPKLERMREFMEEVQNLLPPLIYRQFAMQMNKLISQFVAPAYTLCKSYV